MKMPRIVSIVFLVLAGIFLALKAYPQSAKIEKKIIHAVQKNNTTALELLKTTVNINSGSLNLAGVRQVGEVMSEAYRSLGFDVRWIDGQSWNRAGHMVATHYGKKGPKILLIGHLDTVFEPDSPFQTYTMLNDSMMHGPGALDMKGGNVIMWLALKSLREAGCLEDLQVMVFLVGDEELNGEPLALSKNDLIEAGKWADIAIGFEDGDGTSTHANISRRGSTNFVLRVQGVAAHSSQIFQPETGSGAIFEAARILHEFHTQLSLEENLTFNPGMIIGGNEVHFNEGDNKGIAYGKNNIVSREVIVRGDLRAVSRDQLARARETMIGIVQNHLPLTSATIDFGDDGYPPMTMTEGNRKLLHLLSNISEDMGYGPVEAVNPRNSGAADISFVADDVDMAIDGMGLCGTGGHTEDETANIYYLPIEASRTAVLLYRLSQGLTD